MASRPSILRPAAVGLSAGMLLGAGYLAVKAIMMSISECAPATTAEDCNLELGIAAEMSRVFTFLSLGLMLLGIGVFLLFRPKQESAL